MCGGCGLRSNRARSVPPLCSATSGCSCVRSSLRFLTLWLQIAVQRLQDCSRFVLPCASRDAGLELDVARRIVMAAWMLHGLPFGRKSQGRKPCVFSGKVAPAGDARYRVRGGCELGSAKAGSSPQCNGCFDVFCLFLHIAVTSCFGILACKTHCNGCIVICVAMCVERAGLEPDAARRIVMAAWMWASFWEEAGAGNLVFFRVKWLRPTMKGSSCVRRVRAGFGQGWE